MEELRKTLLDFADHLNTYKGFEDVRFDFMVVDYLDTLSNSHEASASAKEAAAGQRSVGQSGRVGCVHNTLKYIGPWYICEDCGTHLLCRPLGGDSANIMF